LKKKHVSICDHCVREACVADHSDCSGEYQDKLSRFANKELGWSSDSRTSFEDLVLTLFGSLALDEALYLPPCGIACQEWVSVSVVTTILYLFKTVVDLFVDHGFGRDPRCWTDCLVTFSF
jgi:hypothetical protein